ncbi:nitroreductase family protein [Amycolatopsis sp.]|uniref:nitroreductase family protein n=1 Tax=Amycolatopsis sp. TaxID=37632 RepID=UPI002C548D53|nr:nitroreductase family protein [Amycolatopsis sp.]HVV10523.1 nitroreductase family protein [Amycolatopsis sp.]
MDIREAVESRRSVRGFLDRAVDLQVLREVLRIAARAPSGGNLQPWRVYLLAGEPLARLKKQAAELARTGAPVEDPEYAIYPPDLTSPYRERRSETGRRLYGALGISRHDRAARKRWFTRNYELFGAPAGLFCYVDRQMGAAQWADLGMFLQTVMLLLRREGLASCPQEAWSVYHRTVAEVIGPPPELMLFCGMAIGYEDPAEPANAARTGRAPVEEFATFIGWE